jgi:hypothetical protein
MSGEIDATPATIRLDASDVDVVAWRHDANAFAARPVLGRPSRASFRPALLLTAQRGSRGTPSRAE